MSSTPKTLRCAVVGTGVVGEWHIKVLSRLPGVELAAVCDTLSTKARSSLDKNSLAGIPVYDSQEQMLAKEKLDVVNICTPSGDHFRPAMMAMERGINVITEKPMEIAVDRIDEMGEAAKKHGVRLAAIFQNRWNPANRAIADAAAAGRFGRMAWVSCITPWYRPDKYYEEGGWRGTWKLDGGGAIMNQSVHAIDLLQWIGGPVKRVSAYASSRIHGKIEVEDTLSGAVEFASGAFGTIMGTTAMYPGSAVRIEVGGENGTAISENGLRTFQFRDEHPGDAGLRERFAPALPEHWKKRLSAAGGEAILSRLGLDQPTSTGGGASATDVKLDLHTRNIQHILDAWTQLAAAASFSIERQRPLTPFVAAFLLRRVP